MLESIKKFFTKDKTIEIRLLDIIQQQQKFIDKNINERVVYVDSETGYTNVTRYDDDDKHEPEDYSEQMPEEMYDVTPDQLEKHLNPNQAEGDK